MSDAGLGASQKLITHLHNTKRIRTVQPEMFSELIHPAEKNRIRIM